MESKRGMQHDLLKVKNRWNFWENSTYQKRCPFELALLALFWGISWVYSGTIMGP
jgi:hypothetical protein